MHRLLTALLLVPSLALAGITADQGLPSPSTVNPWRVTIVAPPGSTTSTVLTTNPSNPAQAAVVTRPIFPIEHLSAFGELEVVEKTPIISLDFNYAINTLFTTTTTANGGSAAASGSMAILQTSAANNGSSKVESKAAVRYIAGTGVFATFTARFTTGVASSRQEACLGDDTDGVCWAYSGATFGVILRNGGSDTFTAQTAFNVDRLNGAGASGFTLTPTNLNLFKVEFGWHGSGPAKYYVFDALNGRWILAHVIGTGVTAPRILNPTLPLHLKVINTGNATNLTLASASMGGYREGGPSPAEDAMLSAPGAVGDLKSVTTELALVTLRDNATVFSGQTNRVRVKVTDLVLVGQSGTANVTFRVLLNTTLGGAPSFTDFDATTSVAATDVAGTTVTGGRLVYQATVPSNGVGDNVVIDLTNRNIVLNPGDTVTVTATSSGAAQNCAASIMWSELFSG